MKVVAVSAFALVIGILASAAIPKLPQTASSLLALAGVQAKTDSNPASTPGGHGSATGQVDERAPEGMLLMTEERIAAARIEVAEARSGSLVRHITLPGTVVPDRNTIRRVAARIVGTVAELKKGLGDHVETGELLAVVDSREVAEARSEYIAAHVNFGLQKTLFEREETLWKSRIQAEQQYLRAKNAFVEAQVRVQLAQQKLAALGLSDDEIKRMSAAPEAMTALQRYEVRSPGRGQVVERMVDIGTPVGGEGQAKELFSIIDLRSVWVELAVASSDLGQIREGSRVSVSTAGGDIRTEGRIVFVSPVYNPETRSARVFAAIPNDDLRWRPGSFVTAQVQIEQTDVEVRVPRAALQTVESSTVVFVRTETGFERRKVVLGKQDSEFAEIAFGVDPGEQIAVANTFLLKAELGKSEAEHSH